jgi:Flp pilus assembly protein TadG
MLMRSLNQRRGSVIPLLAICLVGLMGFVALALDIGVLMISRNQCQNAADSAAMAGARTLNGDTTKNNNYDNVLPNAKTAVSANMVLAKAVDPTTQMTLTIGDYYYDSSSNAFKISASALGKSGDNWTLVQATVTSSTTSFFARASGFMNLNAAATATAAHRPRDVCLVIDLSGSMRFESMLAYSYFGARTMSMNPSTVYPQFAHYSGNSSLLTYSADQQVTSGEIIGDSNIETTTSDANASVISGFYGDSTAFGTSVPAFSSASSSYATTPGGDAPLKVSKGSGAGYAHHVSEFLANNSTTITRDWRWELDGYAAYSAGGVNSNMTGSTATDYTNAAFNGYTMGPGYWGKSFMTWPPDPRVPLTTTYYTSSASLTSPGQIQQIVKQTMLDLWGAVSASTTNITTTGSTNGTNYIWKSWTSFASAAALKTHLTGSSTDSTGFAGLGLTASDTRVIGLLRLYNRNGGAGMPKDSSSNAMPCDWRTRFFTDPTTSMPLFDNSDLWSSGTLQAPSSTTYLINYNAILDWIKNCGTNPFPNQLRAGGIVYYTAIPSTIDTGTFPPADPNQRFWKEYIDNVLGVQQTGGSGSTPTYNVITQYTGYGADVNWGTVATNAVPSGWPTSTSIGYIDNPQRPLLRGWFGPLTLIDYLGNYNASDPSNNNGPRLWWPGTVAEAPTYQTKLGMQASLKDIIQNHPNDNVSVIFFSSPKSSSSATGYYNFTRAPLGRDERLMINSLWFSPKVISSDAEISVYNSSGASTGDIYSVPRANGGTCYTMGLMLAYNQFSANSNLVNYTANAPAGCAGGNGRNGSTKLLVFESDGMVNTGCSANLVSSTNGQGYYQVRIADANNYSASGTEFPTGVSGVTFSTGATQSQGIATQICADQSAGGYATSRKKVWIHCIAFGSLFNPSNASSYKTNALQNLASLEVIGGIQSSGATTLASNKIVTGTYATRIANLQAALSAIMQDGVQVSLIASGSGKP